MKERRMVRLIGDTRYLSMPRAMNLDNGVIMEIESTEKDGTYILRKIA